MISFDVKIMRHESSNSKPEINEFHYKFLPELYIKSGEIYHTADQLPNLDNKQKK